MEKQKMTQEETMKVWTDLSARVMYHPKIRVTNTYLNQAYDEVLTMANFTQFSNVRYEVKPYLRPMSSMTKNERKQFCNLANCDEYELKDFITYSIFEMNVSYKVYDWLNAHHFDYRGLIDKCLALPAPKGMYE